MHYFAIPGCIVLLFVLGIVCEGSPSQSKLSLHAGPFLGDSTNSFVSIGKPRLIKLLDSFGPAASLKKAAPGVVIIGRIYLANQPQDGDPAEAAQKWWSEVQSTVTQFADVDYWEGYNEPSVGSVAEITWIAAFDKARVELMAEKGKFAVIGCFSVGTPDVSNPAIIEAYYPAIDAAMKHGALLGLHEYSAPTMLDGFDNSTGEGWYTGRYRKLYKQYLLPTGRNITCAITENGIDGGVIGKGGGWKDFASPTNYLNQLQWYDGLMRADPYVLGSTIFLMDGTGDWDSFSINGQVASLLAQYLAQQ